MEHIRAAAAYAGLHPEDDQIVSLHVYEQWLRSEGHRAGGIGPDELSRLQSRHIADSVVFAGHFPHDADEVWDLGTGIGLPGIPLAIVLPEVQFRLIDRSGRRVDLLRRVVRILKLENCQIVHAEIDDLGGEVSVIVSRASLPPAAMLPVAQARLSPGGVAVIAGSRKEEPRYHGWETVEIPSDVLDQPVWLLIMRRA